MDEATRLVSLLNQLKINASQFAKKTGIPQGSISAITLGKKRITIDMLHLIIETYPQVSTEWLLRGVGNMFHDDIEGKNKEFSGSVDYNAIKSTISTQADGLPDEEIMKGIIAENLRTTGKRWKFTQVEMLELLGGSVGRGGASTYFRGDTLPRLPLLLRLERLTGWPLVVLATRALDFDELPPVPLLEAPVLPKVLSDAESEDLAAELNRLKMRIVRIITQLKGEL